MGERHADTLFSLAYDDELDPGARRRFDTHLEGCARCAAAFDDYRTSLEAVRALPMATMPATVRLPVGPPQTEAGRAALLGRLRAALLQPRPIGGAAALAAVGIAAVVLAVHHGGSGTTTSGASDLAMGSTRSSGLSVEAAPGAAGAAPQAPALQPGAFSQALLGQPSPCLVTTVSPAGQQSTSGFPYAARADVGSGLQLVLATNSDTYSPGATVPIYARLTGGAAGSGGSDVVPCVTLQQVQPVPAPAAAPQQDHGSTGQVPAAGAPTAATPIAVATAAPTSADGSASSKQQGSSAGPVLTLTIPAGVAHGTHLRLVAFIPAYARGNTTGKDLQVTLDITVR